MEPDHAPRIESLPELPRDCDELKKTADRNSETRLQAHLDCLPGLGRRRASLLNQKAIDTSNANRASGSTESESSVLGLPDLLRTQTQGYYTLHPRVQQIVQVSALDSLLYTIAERLDIREKFLAYQYPHLQLECRGSAPDPTALHPPEYHITTIETLRELRANDILTTVCRPGDSIPSCDTVRATLDSLEQEGINPHAVFTLLLEDNGPISTPMLVFHDDNFPDGTPTREELFDHVEYLRKRYSINIELQTLSERTL